MANEEIYKIGIFSFTIVDNKISMFIKEEVESELALPLLAKQVLNNIQTIVNCKRLNNTEEVIGYTQHVYNTEVHRYGGKKFAVMKYKEYHEL